MSASSCHNVKSLRKPHRKPQLKPLAAGPCRPPSALGRAAGFTLVEIAIVLVIIGLLLGGVLKGQELIVQARIKNLINELNGVAAAVHAYQDRYRALPGDEKDALVKLRWSGVSGGDGNGLICGGFNAVAAAGDTGSCSESSLFWQHLRAAGLITGTPDSTEIPRNAVGGQTGVQAGAYGLSGHVLCTSNLPARVANSIDTHLDDGLPGTGSVRSLKQSSLTDAAGDQASTDSGYVDDGQQLYILCRSL